MQNGKIPYSLLSIGKTFLLRISFRQSLNIFFSLSLNNASMIYPHLNIPKIAFLNIPEYS